jgi:hypothetical protein
MIEMYQVLSTQGSINPKECSADPSALLFQHKYL